MTVGWIRSLDSWREAQQWSEFWTMKVLRAIMFLSQNKFLRDQKNFVSITEELDWTARDFQRLHSKDWVCVGFEMSITWKIFLSITSTPFNSTVFPMTQRKEMKLWKQKSSRFIVLVHIFKVTPTSSFSKSSGNTRIFSKVFTKVFSWRHSFLGVDINRIYQTPQRLIRHMYTHKHVSPLTYKSSIHQNH